VATDVGGAREAIVHGDTGYLVAVGDHEQMAEQIIALLSDPESARSMGESGRRRVNEKFSSLKQVQNVESLYTELLTSKHKKHKQQRTKYKAQSTEESRLSRVDPN
jgi:glycosyltransferase involved in cell wall biosynthesis